MFYSSNGYFYNNKLQSLLVVLRNSVTVIIVLTNTPALLFGQFRHFGFKFYDFGQRRVQFFLKRRSAFDRRGHGLFGFTCQATKKRKGKKSEWSSTGNYSSGKTASMEMGKESTCLNSPSAPLFLGSMDTNFGVKSLAPPK